MGKEKIVIDTNIIISALGWEGKSRELLRKIIDNEYELLISNKQLAEIKRVLYYPKFGFTQEQKNRLLKIIFQVAKVKEIKTELEIIKEDPSDNMLLECAIEAEAKYLISRDKHLKKLKRYKSITIISVSDFLKEHS
jgi:putative PIN family toxin of toxin-antitoxin system